MNNIIFDGPSAQRVRIDPDILPSPLETAWGWNARTAAMVNEILANLNPNVVSGAKSISPTVQQDDGGVRVYTVPGSNGGEYTVTVDASSPDNVRVACSCPFFRYQGPEHWAKVGGYLYGEPVGDASPPIRKDPDGKNRVCKHIAAVLKQPTYKMAATTPVPAQFDVNEPGILTRNEYLAAINRSDKHHSDDSYDFSLSSINRPPASLIGRLYPVYGRDVKVLHLWESTSGQYITSDTNGSTAAPIAVLHNGTLYHTALGAKIPNEYVDAYGVQPAMGGLEYKPLGIQKRVLVKYIDEYMALVNNVAKHNLAKYPIVLQRDIHNGEMLALRAARQPEKNKGVELAVLDSQSKVLGFASDEWGATLITVAKEARGRGVGRWLAKVWHEWNPKYDSGGMTSRGQALMSAHWADRVREFLDRGWYSQMVRDGRITPERVKLITKDLPQRSTSAPSKFELSPAPPRSPPAPQPMVKSDGQSYILVYDRAILTGNTTVDTIDENLIYGYAFIQDTAQHGTYLYSIEYERRFDGFTLRAILQLARDNGYRLYVGTNVAHDLIVADAESIPGVKRDGDYLEVTRDVFPLRDVASLERVMRRRVDKFGELGDRLVELAESKW